MGTEPLTTANTARTVKILVVDDDQHDHLLFKMAARDAECSVDVEFAIDGVTAIDALKKAARANQLPDLVILDIAMPNIDGHETLHKLREDPATANIDAIMFSNSHRQSEIRKSIAVGALWHEVKPSAYTDLVAFIEQAVARVLKVTN